MSNLIANFTLSAYRMIGAVAYPFMGPFLRLRASRGKEDRERRYERYGYPSSEKPAGPLVWFHAASVGESMAVLPLVQHVNDLGIHTIMTTGTVTSAQVVKRRMPKGTYHQFVPLDLKPAVQRFINHWQPDLAVFTESEIWPMTVLELAARHIPQVLVNARMSDRSFKRWQKSAGLAETLFENFAHVIAQSELDGDRFRQLGARPVTISGNLKVDTDSLPFNNNELQLIKRSIGSRPCWVAVSTHDGEEETVAKVHHFMKPRLGGLLTIIVPRHPERSQTICALLKGAGLKVAVRSQNQSIEPDTEIYLGDTIGEMGLYLRLARIAFVGRSLSAEGGQNPLEPASTGTAIVSGRNVHNFRDSYQNLLDAGGARLVADENMLAANVEFLFQNPNECEKMISAAKTCLDGMRGALSATSETLDAYLFPLTVKRNLENIG